MKIVGYRFGTFTNDAGEQFPVNRIYCVEPFGDRDKSVHDGVCTREFKLAGTDVLNGIQLGEDVVLYFDQYKRVSMIQPMK